ncbi:MAG: AAA family ATPase [Caldivirga sp.]
MTIRTFFSLNFLFGLRQVGKSTALLLAIKRLLDEGVNPKAIFYYSCDKHLPPPERQWW